MPKATSKLRGHPVMFRGPRQKMSVKITTEARAMIADTRAMLKAEGHGHAATEAAAVEYLVRRGAKKKRKEMAPVEPSPQQVVSDASVKDLAVDA